jgi:Fe2+ transport system protein FeoA
MDVLPLSELRPGQQATILRVHGSALSRRRYLEMGFVRGEQVAVERVAPLGDPVEYRLKGYHLSLRRADAAQILVRPERGQGGG